MKRLLRKVLPTALLHDHVNRQAIMRFADTLGLVYFGHVSQASDEYTLIRGLTLSNKHRDNHYTVGTIFGYDVSFVERKDTLHFPGKPSVLHVWHILQIDLHTSKDLPHVFVGLHTHTETFYAHLFAKFGTLTKLPLGIFGPHTGVFSARYAVYAEPEHALTTERLFDPSLTAQVGQHFGTLTFELADGSLYLYSQHQRVTKKLLDTMLQNGVWLARHIDARAEYL